MVYYKKMPGSKLRKDFPFFQHNPDIAFLDSAASSLTPSVVTNAVAQYYDQYGVNIHRGVYRASMEATEVFENSREKVRKLIHDGSKNPVVYIRNATEGFNLLASSLAQVTVELSDYITAWQTPLSPEDVILISESEHHSNIVPWQMLATKTGARVEYLSINIQDGSLNKDDLLKLKDAKVKIVSLSAASNVTGIIHDLTPFAEFARQKGALFIVDAAQAICHKPLDVNHLDADFLIFSGHKMLGPSGIGAIWGKKELFEKLPPYMGGGDMILSVKKEGSTYNELPHRFEAGTPHIAGAFGLAAAIDYLEQQGLQHILEHEQKLAYETIDRLKKEGIKVHGPQNPNEAPRSGVVSFEIPGVHPHDVGTILDEKGVAIRAGHHCCQILMQSFQVAATARASFYLYNDVDDIDRLIDAVRYVKKIFHK